MRAPPGPCASLLAMVLVGLGACSSQGSRGPPSSDVLVTKVTDGDTIHVAFGGHDERVRLIGVDTPEVPWYGAKGECFGVEAGRAGGFAMVVGVDRYGRLLAYVYLGRELFNLTLVRLGYATADPVPPDLSMATAFAAAEREARAAGRGLWSACPASPG